jgi:hypothetical protein
MPKVTPINMVAPNFPSFITFSIYTLWFGHSKTFKSQNVSNECPNGKKLIHGFYHGNTIGILCKIQHCDFFWCEKRWEYCCQS